MALFQIGVGFGGAFQRVPAVDVRHEVACARGQIAVQTGQIAAAVITEANGWNEPVPAGRR
jgi:hypothetical protein